MRSKFLALSWEYLSYKRKIIFVGIICILFLIIIVSSIFRYTQSQISPREYIEIKEDIHLEAILLPVYFVELVILSFIMLDIEIKNEIKSHFHFRHRHLTLPVSTKYLVAILMILEMIIVFILFLVLNVIFLYTSGIRIPLLGYALLTATWMAILQGAFWCSPSGLVNTLMIFLGGALLYFFYVYRNGVREVFENRDFWRNLSSWQLAFMGFCIFCSYILSYIGIKRTRRGDLSLPRYLEKRIEEHLFNESERRETFSSPVKAQIWMETRRQKHVLSFIILGWFSLLCISTASGIINFDTIKLAVLGILLLFFGICIIMGAIKSFRRINFNDKNLGLEGFRAAKPISSRDLSLAMLVSGLLEILFTFFLLGTCCLSAFFVLLKLKQWNTVRNLLIEFLNADIFHLRITGYRFAFFLGYGILLLAWISFGCALSFSVKAKKSKLHHVLFIGIGLVSLLVLIFWFHFPRSFVSGIIRKYMWKCFGVLCLGGTSIAYYYSLNFGHLRSKDIGKAILFWAVLLIVTFCIIHNSVYDSLDMMLFAMGISALAILPFALAPMALYRNRHR